MLVVCQCAGADEGINIFLIEWVLSNLMALSAFVYILLFWYFALRFLGYRLAFGLAGWLAGWHTLGFGYH